MKNPLTPAGIEPATFRFVAQYLNHCATVVPIYWTVKVKWSRYRPGVAQRVSRGIALLFHDCGTRIGVSGQQHAPAALYPPGKTWHPFYRRLGGPQGGRDSILNRPARSQSLYRLSYPAHIYWTVSCVNYLFALFQHFQDVEEAHLKQMKEFLSTYAEVLQNNHDLIGQVCSLYMRYKVNTLVTIKITVFLLWCDTV